MRGLPIHHPGLRVEAVDVTRLGELLAFALVTPWFVSVIVVGPEPPPAGATRTLELGGGRFELNRGDEGTPPLTLPLLSPVLELADMEAARAVAREALRLVLGAPAPATARPKGVARRALFGALLGGGK